MFDESDRALDGDVVGLFLETHGFVLDGDDGFPSLDGFDATAFAPCERTIREKPTIACMNK